MSLSERKEGLKNLPGLNTKGINMTVKDRKNREGVERYCSTPRGGSNYVC